jgi:hypothetical protein
VGPGSIAEAIWEVLVEWGNLTRWLGSRLACDDTGDVEFELETDPYSKSACWLYSEISPNFPVRVPMMTSGSVTSPVFGFGVMVRRRWKEPAPSALQTQEPKMKAPRLKAAIGLVRIEAIEFAMRSPARAPTWHTCCRCFRPATYQGDNPM